MGIGVVGGGGFIGTRLVRRLAKCGHRVKVGDVCDFADSNIEYSHCDVRDADAVARFVTDLEVIYNLAAEHRDDVRPVDRYETVNVGGACVICEAASNAPVSRIVFTSSVAVYGVPDAISLDASPNRPF